MNVFDFLFGIPSNHVITSCVFFQWLYFVLSFTTFTIFSNNCLLILPISGLQGFISRHVGLFLKFSLWSLRVIKDSLSAVVLMRSAKSRFLAICISVLIISYLPLYLFSCNFYVPISPIAVHSQQVLLYSSCWFCQLVCRGGHLS